MKTQVAIIGGGPAGLLLAHLLGRGGVECVVLERHSRAHVLERIRAGILEAGTVQLLRDVGLGARMDREGHEHDGTLITWAGRDQFLIDVRKYTGRPMMAYGQTAITEDLYAAHDAAGSVIVNEAADVAIHGVAGDKPFVTYRREGRDERIDCDYVAGCDGYHGVSRRTIPDNILHTFDKTYPFGWLGVMAPTPPLPDIVYAHHERGFALASMRSPTLSRYYIQCDPDTRLEDWPDERFWEELRQRFPPEMAERIVVGPTIEKSIAPLRSFVAEPMRYGRLFLAGDAAHIVPPTGAKGLNLAVSDVYYLARALTEVYRVGATRYLDTYSDMTLRRVWSAERLSWWLTNLLHRFPDDSVFDERVRESELDHLMRSERARAWLAEQYAGMPVED